MPKITRIILEPSIHILWPLVSPRLFPAASDGRRQSGRETEGRQDIIITAWPHTAWSPPLSSGTKATSTVNPRHGQGGWLQAAGPGATGERAGPAGRAEKCPPTPLPRLYLDGPLSSGRPASRTCSPPGRSCRPPALTASPGTIPHLSPGSQQVGSGDRRLCHHRLSGRSWGSKHGTPGLGKKPDSQLFARLESPGGLGSPLVTSRSNRQTQAHLHQETGQEA